MGAVPVAGELAELLVAGELAELLELVAGGALGLRHVCGLYGVSFGWDARLGSPQRAQRPACPTAKAGSGYDRRWSSRCG